MRIEVHCYETDNGTTMEFVDALIEHFLNGGDGKESAMKELAEITDYIQVYLKYNTEGK